MRLDDRFEADDDGGPLREKMPLRKKIPSALKKWLKHTFRERRIYLRSADNQAHLYVLRPWLQVSFVGGFCVCLFWLAFATVNVAFKDQLIALEERRFRDVQIIYEDRLAATRAAVDGLNGKLLLDQDQYLRKVDELKAELDVINGRQSQIESFFSRNFTPATIMTGSSRKQDVLQRQGPVKGTDKKTRGQVVPTGAGKGDLGLQNRSSIYPVQGIRQHKTSPVPWVFRKKFAKPFETHDGAMIPLYEINNSLAILKKRQIDSLENIDQLSARRLQAANKAIRRVELDPERIIRDAPDVERFIGGPFISPSGSDQTYDEVSQKLLDISQKVNAFEKLTLAIRRMPLAYPLSGKFRTTSKFGYRNDPFRSARAMHAGYDFKAAYGHPVRATADGVVTRAGRYGAYGKAVVIKHPYGITTLYAHMSRVKVKKGQRVRLGQIIGNLGNTGRSTGAHLHYEIRVSKRALSAGKFWKMRSVLQSADASGKNKL